MLSAEALRWHLVFENQLNTNESGGRSGLIASKINDHVTALVDVIARQFALVSARPLSKDTTEHFTADLLLPRLVAYDGHLVLHGGLVNSPRGALCFIGESGRGKSTLTGSLHRAGYALISDDAVLLQPGEAGYSAKRLYPSLRLFPDSIEQLFPDADATFPVADYTVKRRLSFAEGPDEAMISAIFHLGPPANDGRIQVVPMPPAAACMTIIANSFALEAEDTAEACRRFALAADAAQNIPVFELHYPRDFSVLPALHAQIFEAASLIAEQQSL